MNDPKIITDLVKDFNSLLKAFIHDLAKLDKNSILSNNIDVVNSHLDLNTDKFINLYCDHVLPFKEKIYAKDEQFFMDKTYVNKINEFTEDKSVSDTVLDHIFDFKKKWKQLKKSNKDNIITYVVYLTKLSEKYIDQISS